MKFFIKRAFTKKTIFIVAIFTIVINYLSVSSAMIKDNFYSDTLQSPWTDNFLVIIDTASFINMIYIFIIAGSVLADTFVKDRKTGLFNIIATKESFAKYVRQTIVYNMLIIGFLSIIPSLINLLLWFCLRANVPLVYFNTMNLNNILLFSDVFLKSKILFFVLHLIKISIVAMTISNFSLFVNTLFNNKYLGTPLAFILDNIFYLIFIGMHWGIISLNLLITSLYRPDFLTIFIFLLYNSLTLFYFYKYSHRKDIL